jgi:hypothetical protein
MLGIAQGSSPAAMTVRAHDPFPTLNGDILVCRSFLISLRTLPGHADPGASGSYRLEFTNLELLHRCHLLSMWIRQLEPDQGFPAVIPSSSGMLA